MSQQLCIVYNSVEEQEKVNDLDIPLSFNEDRHLEPIEGINVATQLWRMRERMKTVSVALVLCLNCGVDPPDIVKTVPCARSECWIDPTTLPAPKALERIGANLQQQYERWQPRARYKQSLDPTSDEVKKLCTSLRRNAKEERVLFHYNGHGVPKPTTNGEIWVFNRQYTQYIPLSIYDLQKWMGAPSIYVYDCSNAGIIVESFKQFAAQHEHEYEQLSENSRMGSPGPPNFQNCIQLAACSANQILPMNPDLPADVFTSCLTTPIKLALRWFILQNNSKLVPRVTMDLLDKIPGLISDRRTMLGELNWIFTAITDTIAWNTLPRDLFQKLFRQDLLVASLFRNFLLAERIMRSCDCTPVSSPALPTTHQHPMWNAWDISVDLCLTQLPRIVNSDEPFHHLPFFEDQLTAFEVWLEGGRNKNTAPEQLPIVLQVLLSQVHRVRALELLGRFLDLGPWAVSLALSVGIFPYVLKLLQSFAKELKPLLVFIWAKILAVDNSCQADLVRDGAHKYFLAVLQDTTVSPQHRTQAVFVLACIVNDFREGQEAALQGSLVSTCLEQLHEPSPPLRQWVAICLGKLWDHYDKARWTGVRDIAHEKLYSLLTDPSPEVRAAAVYSLGTFINSVSKRSEHANNIDHSVAMTLTTIIGRDMSCLVRKELVNALQWVVLTFEPVFFNIALKENTVNSFNDLNKSTSSAGMRRAGSRDRLRVSEDLVINRLQRVNSSSSIHNMTHPSLNQVNSGSLGKLPSLGYGSVYMKIWSALTSLESDPHPEVAKLCSTVMKHIRDQAEEYLNTQRDSDNRSNSMSLPPSPKSGNYLSGDSPPTLHSSSDLQKLQRSTMPNRRRRGVFSTTSNDSEEHIRQPLVSTSYVSWSAKRFTRSEQVGKPLDDVESQTYHERDWRFCRNNNIRNESVDEQKRALINKLESQIFNTRTPIPPSILQFHPFEQQIAVAGNDSFAIWDWGTGAKTLICQNKSNKFSSSRVSALEWVNGHDIGMLMVAVDDGSIKLWRPNQNSGPREPLLVSAWQAFSDIERRLSDVTVTWEQHTSTLITAGDSRYIRFWDAQRELHSHNFLTGTDTAVTAMDSTYAGLRVYRPVDDGREGCREGLVVAGCADGSVRVFDRRCSPGDARVKTWMEHMGSVMAVQLRGGRVVSGSSEGDVKIYDIRTNESVLTTKVLPSCTMTCMAIHRKAEIYACGSQTQAISVHNMRGTNVNNVRWYEGFMGHRIGSVNCMNFHPYKVVLAAGTADCSVLVYGLEGRR